MQSSAADVTCEQLWINCESQLNNFVLAPPNCSSAFNTQILSSFIIQRNANLHYMGPTPENLSQAFANNKGTDQPAQSDQCNCDSYVYRVSYL